MMEGLSDIRHGPTDGGESSRMRSRPGEGRGHALQPDRPLRADRGRPPAPALRDAGGRRAGAAVRRLDALPRLRRAVAGDVGRLGAVADAPPPTLDRGSAGPRAG